MIPAIALMIGLTPTVDAWLLKAPLAKDAKSSWSIVVNADVGGQDHEARFSLEQTVSASDEKEAKAILAWKDLTVDGNAMEELLEFKSVLGKRGEIKSVDSEFGDDARRMLNVFLFLYPDKPVAVGEKWDFESPAEKADIKKFKVKFEASAIEKIKDIEALKILCTFDESGAEAMHSDSIFWLSREGKTLKFEAKVKNWVVPMAGTGGPVNATIKGELISK
jgi:hypothetical protein